MSESNELRARTAKAAICNAFDFGPGGNLAYVSNANREDTIRALRARYPDDPALWAAHTHTGA